MGKTFSKKNKIERIKKKFRHQYQGVTYEKKIVYEQTKNWLRFKKNIAGQILT